MAVVDFLSVPVTVREQIYAELLTDSPAIPTAEGNATSSTLCRLLFLNHQIKHEVGNFLESQLCVLIKINNIQFVEWMLESPPELPFISQLRSQDGTMQKQPSTAIISMEVEIYMYHNRLERKSFPAFLIPASSTKDLLKVLSQPKWASQTTQSSVSFTLLETFSHTQEAALSKLMQPWIEWPCPQHFVGVGTDPMVSRQLVLQLKKTLLRCDYAPRGQLGKIKSLVSGFEQTRSEDWMSVVERLQMAVQYIKVIWDCHLECFERWSGDAIEKDFVTQLWWLTSETAALHVQMLINAAHGMKVSVEKLQAPTKSVDKVLLEEARYVAESTIRFLDAHQPGGSDETIGEDQKRQAIRRAKAKLFVRVHWACKALGDVGAATAYLKESRKYGPESANMLDE